MENQVQLFFHGSLADFLPKARRGQWIPHTFSFTPSLKDVVEALGVPHPEIGQLLLNGQDASFAELLVSSSSRVEVFPVQPENRGMALPPLQEPIILPARLVADVHLGKLARYLRLLGFGVFYQNNLKDATIAQLAEQEQRIVLTRDIGLLKHKTIKWGYWLRSQQWEEQLWEVMNRFGLADQIKPFTRCMVCNGEMRQVQKEAIWEKLPPKTRLYFTEFYQCALCSQVYWKGSHYDRMQAFLSRFQENRA